jgi:hypothetical protein
MQALNAAILWGPCCGSTSRATFLCRPQSPAHLHTCGYYLQLTYTTFDKHGCADGSPLSSCGDPVTLPEMHPQLV